MARISKKNISNNIVKQEIIEVQKNYYNTAIYTRLSKEDSGKVDSDTIENQIDIISKYIESKEDLDLKEIFIDNGYTGVNFHRPDFKRLLDNVKSGKINCVVVKDLSRLGRDYISVGEYLYSIFPSLNLRVISINDNYDSKINKGFDDIVVSLKNLVNASYSRDLSKKVTSALHQKQLNGNYIGGYLYGYKKLNGEKNKLYVDENVKDIVLEIFTLRAKGASFYEIEKILNDRKIPSPKKYLTEQGILNKYNDYDKLLWNESTISKLVKNYAYLGHTAQGKVKHSIYYDKRKYIDKNNWIIVENTHEAIISKELWDKVQQVNKDKTYRGKKVTHKENIFRKLLYCKVCGYTYERKARKLKNNDSYSYKYYCRGRKNSKHLKKTNCTNEPVSEKILEDALIIIINKYLEILDYKVTRCKGSYDISIYKTEKSKTLNEISKVKNLKLKLYEKFEKGLVDLEDYKFMYDNFNLDLQVLEKKLNDLILKEDNKNENLKPIIEKAKKIKSLNRNIIELFIEKIIVSDNKSIEIIWKFKGLFGGDTYN